MIKFIKRLFTPRYILFRSRSANISSDQIVKAFMNLGVSVEIVDVDSSGRAYDVVKL